MSPMPIKPPYLKGERPHPHLAPLIACFGLDNKKLFSKKLCVTSTREISFLKLLFYLSMVKDCRRCLVVVLKEA